VPLVASGPAQPPEPVQDVALVELHVSMEAPPLLTVGGAALIDAVGCGGSSLPPHAANSSAAASPHSLQIARIVFNAQQPRLHNPFARSRFVRRAFEYFRESYAESGTFEQLNPRTRFTFLQSIHVREIARADLWRRHPDF
jgi:hypothetical protein